MDECRKSCKRAVSIEEEKERESSSTSSISKKTKLLGLSESEESKSPNELFRGQDDRENAAASSSATTVAAAEVVVIWNSGDTGSSLSSSPSRSSSDDSCEVAKASFGFMDLKARSFEIEGSTCVHNKFSGERYPSSEFTDEEEEEEEEEMESQPAKKEAEYEVLREEPPTKTGTWKMRIETPSQEEIDEFFGAVERETQRKFSEKYNFDFVNEVPLEGRYQWVRFKQ